MSEPAIRNVGSSKNAQGCDVVFKEVPSFESAQAIASHILGEATIHTPLQSRIARYIGIDEACRNFLRALQSDPMVFRPNLDIYRSQSEMRQIYIVQSGWLVGYTLTSAGGRHIYRIYQPGDLIGIEDMNWNYHSSTVGTVTPCVLTSFSKSALREIFETSPRLARTIFSIVMMDQVQSFDELRAIGRLDALARIAALILRLHSRARAAGTLADDDTVEIPLTQAQIGDAVGLTNVSVSRSLSELVQRGCISRNGSAITLHDVAAMAEMSDFIDRYENVDTEWVSASLRSREQRA